MTEALSPFSSVPRVTYERNPLSEVVCQLRFPPLLRLQAEPPFQFQERVRERFPIYEDSGTQLDLPLQLSRILGNVGKQQVHKFFSEDGIWAVSVEANFFAITCDDYVSWEQFSENLFLSLRAFVEEYHPSFFNRIGLRYQNVIDREWIGQGASWADFINPSLVGPIRELENDLIGARSALHIRLGEGVDAAQLQHGLVELEDRNDRCYLLDFDYYTELKTDPKEAENVINRLHSYSGPAFQWAITKPLHEAMGPT